MELFHVGLANAKHCYSGPTTPLSNSRPFVRPFIQRYCSEMTETVRLEEYTGLIEKRIAVVYGTDAWLPTEFMAVQYITRILVCGRTSPASIPLATDSGWTQIWRSPGAKEWSCLLGILQYMPGPLLLVVTSDVALSPKIVASLRSVCVMGPTDATVVLLRTPEHPVDLPIGDQQVFFPVHLSPPLLHLLQEWMSRVGSRSLDLKAILPQLSASGYALTVTEGTWFWYKPSDSPPLATLTVGQVARQIQLLGSLLEGIAKGV